MFFLEAFSGMDFRINRIMINCHKNYTSFMLTYVFDASKNQLADHNDPKQFFHNNAGNRP